MFAIDTDALVADLQAMLAIPSPFLHGQPMIDWLVPRLEAAGLTVATTTRGDLYAQRPGDMPSRAITAHLDTLGTMVVRRRSDGRLASRS